MYFKINTGGAGLLYPTTAERVPYKPDLGCASVGRVYASRSNYSTSNQSYFCGISLVENKFNQGVLSCLPLVVQSLASWFFLLINLEKGVILIILIIQSQ